MASTTTGSLTASAPDDSFASIAASTRSADGPTFSGLEDEFLAFCAAFEDDRERDANALDTGFATIRLTRRRLSDRAAAEAARLHRILARRRNQAA